jgi:fermentation-respiration switch protein FrsA (DUF1100 family)
MQGGADDHISPDSGHKLYDTACEPKTLWYEEEAGHAKLHEFNPERFEQEVCGFLDRNVWGQ